MKVAFINSYVVVITALAILRLVTGPAGGQAWVLNLIGEPSAEETRDAFDHA